MRKTLKRLLGDPGAATVKHYYHCIVDVNKLESEMAKLKPEHYVKDGKMHSVGLSDIGVEAVEKAFGTDSPYALDNIEAKLNRRKASKWGSVYG